MGTTTNLVLGGEGTIGKALCKHLEKIGESAISLDIKTGFDLRKDNLSPYKKMDYVWFLAWDVGGAKYLNNKENFYNIINNNTLITQRTFSFLKEFHIPFLFTSSQLATTDNIYGLTKLMGEEWTKLLGGQLIKLWNVYGWEEPGEKSHVITDMVLQALTKNKIELLTTGDEERQFIYIEDCVKNMVAIRNKKEQDIDLSNNDWKKIIEIANIIGRKLNTYAVAGKNQGYNYKIAAKKNSLLNFDISIEAGIDLVIAESKKYLLKSHYCPTKVP